MIERHAGFRYHHKTMMDRLRIIRAMSLVPLVCFIVAPECRGELGPRLLCDSPVYDFGEMKNTNSVNHAFVIRNKGDANLIITRTRACCGASAKLGSKTIPPGTNTTYAIRMSLRGRKGKMRKSFYLHTNDSARKIVHLKFVGTALSTPGAKSAYAGGAKSASRSTASPPSAPKIVRLDPPAFHFGSISEREETCRTVTVFAGTAKKIRVLAAFAKNPGLKAEVKEIEPRKEYDVELTTKPPIGLGPMHENLTVMVKDYKIRQIKVPLFADVVQDLHALPPQVSFDMPDNGEAKVSAQLQVLSRAKKEFGIVKIETPTRNLKAKTSKLDGEQGWMIEIAGEVKAKDVANKEIRIKTDVLDGRVLVLPIKLNKGTTSGQSRQQPRNNKRASKK